MYDDLRESDSDEECELKIVLTESSSLDPMEEKVDLNVPSAIGAIKDEAIEKAPAFHRENDKEADQGLTSEKQQSPSEHHEERLSHNIHSNGNFTPRSLDVFFKSLIMIEEKCFSLLFLSTKNRIFAKFLYFI